MRDFAQSLKDVQSGYEDLARYEPIASKKVEKLSIEIAELNECIHVFEQQYKKTTYAWF